MGRGGPRAGGPGRVRTVGTRRVRGRRQDRRGSGLASGGNRRDLDLDREGQPGLPDRHPGCLVVVRVTRCGTPYRRLDGCAARRRDGPPHRRHELDGARCPGPPWLSPATSRRYPRTPFPLEPVTCCSHPRPAGSCRRQSPASHPPAGPAAPPDPAIAERPQPTTPVVTARSDAHPSRTGAPRARPPASWTSPTVRAFRPATDLHHGPTWAGRPDQPHHRRTATNRGDTGDARAGRRAATGRGGTPRNELGVRDV